VQCAGPAVRCRHFDVCFISTHAKAIGFTLPVVGEPDVGFGEDTPDEILAAEAAAEQIASERCVVGMGRNRRDLIGLLFATLEPTFVDPAAASAANGRPPDPYFLLEAGQGVLLPSAVFTRGMIEEHTSRVAACFQLVIDTFHLNHAFVPKHRPGCNWGCARPQTSTW
jgi:hypothetical protein